MYELKGSLYCYKSTLSLLMSTNQVLVSNSKLLTLHLLLINQKPLEKIRKTLLGSATNRKSVRMMSVSLERKH